MNPPYEILIHQKFDKQIERVICKPLRNREEEKELQLNKLAEVLNRLKQSPQQNQTSIKKLASFPMQGEQNVEYLYIRVAGARTGKSSGYRLEYALFKEERIVIPLFLYGKRRDNSKQRKNQNAQRLRIVREIRDDYKDYVQKSSDLFSLWEGSIE